MNNRKTYYSNQISFDRDLYCFFHFFFYLCRESFHQDGYQKVKEDVVPQGHEGNEVERRPGGGGFHAVVQDSIPVLLC